MGSLCEGNEARVAIEYFKARQAKGTIHTLPPLPERPSFSVVSLAAHGDTVYFGGFSGTAGNSYLARFSLVRGGELVVMPDEVSREGISRLETTDDGSLWVDAPPDEAEGHVSAIPAAGLWRRSPTGIWQRQLLDAALPEGATTWRMSHSATGLTAAGGDAWLDAVYYDGEPNEPGKRVRRMTFRSRATSKPLLLAAPTRGQTSAVGSVREVRCQP